MSDIATTTSSDGDRTRFGTSRRVIFMDRFMAVVICSGGMGIIVAVLALFLFILWQIIPLFRPAQVYPLAVHELPPGEPLALVADEWSERPALITSDGRLEFFTLARPGQGPALPPSSTDLGAEVGAAITSIRVQAATNVVAFGTVDGRVGLAHVTYEAEYEDAPAGSAGARGRTRRIVESVELDEAIPVGDSKSRVIDVDYGDSGRDKIFAALTEPNAPPTAGAARNASRREVHAVRLTQERSLSGAGKVVLEGDLDLTPQLEGAHPLSVLASSKGDSVIVITDDGGAHYFVRDADTLTRVQRFEPFADRPDRTIANADYLFGDVSIIFLNGAGENRVFSLFSPPEGGLRTWNQTKQFPALEGPSSVFAISTRNKSFLLAHGTHASLRYSTTESIRWEDDLDFTPTLATISGKNDRILFVSADRKLHEFRLNDPHAEAGITAFFGRLWYEGAHEPKFEWQSTGGTDDFEPKLSMVPLLIGTLKGTFYAMIFAVPIALTAALYTSQFAHWKVRAIVKPLMEVMASLPSVVLGFLAALWLAPILETRVPSILLIALFVPTVAFILGWVWPRLPLRYRNRAGLFGEIAVLFIGLGVAGGLGWILGPTFEKLVFTTVDPATQVTVADFRVWWRTFTGATFEQRNSLVVGFMMGFAVIPIIFTITEDSLSNVPANLRSGSLALGATRWQTAIRVVLPTASAGIFSALMVGLGRAVGETMIVLMATGNTPVMDFNIFSGMRTLSANIAVELPEAPHHGTLYRSLFLGAMLLFLMTFTVNTAAEILRQHLRNRYKTA